MNVFSYRYRIFPAFALTVFFVLLPQLLQDVTLYFDWKFYVIFPAVQLFPFMFFRLKKLSVSDEGIRIVFLGKFVLRSLSWSSMVEASEISSRDESSYGKGGHEKMLNALSMKHALSGVSKGTVVKIIVTGGKAFYIDMQQIKNGGELMRILKNRLPFVKSRIIS